jgi:dihydrofolate synthase
MIELGLSRIAQLVRHDPMRWKAVHVAGTNGKGSITAYISGILHEAGVLTGRFNSPHLIDRWDCVSIQDHPVSKSVFYRVEDEVKARNNKLGVCASEFELLTATAFEIFNQAHVQVGVVEVGLGGRLDATNILRPEDVLVSVISKIGLDHQALLGRTLDAIASEKAGIMKKGVPCVVDGTNERSVIEVLSSHAEVARTTLSVVTANSAPTTVKLLEPYFQQMDMVSHQMSNLLVAVKAIKAAEPFLELRKPVDQSLNAILRINWPGRLQTINLHSILGQDIAALLDGAHNSQAAQTLSTYVEKKIRQDSEPVTWILAASKGKDVLELVKCLVKPQDRVIATKFGPVDGMPWVEPIGTEQIVEATERVSGQVVAIETETTEVALRSLPKLHSSGSVVIAGSLYLVSDVLRLLRAFK